MYCSNGLVHSVQDEVDPLTPSFGVLNGACGYGELNRSTWPFWRAVGLGPDNVLSSRAGTQSGCGLCLKITCSADVCHLLSAAGSMMCLHYALTYSILQFTACCNLSGLVWWCLTLPVCQSCWHATCASSQAHSVPVLLLAFHSLVCQCRAVPQRHRHLWLW